MNNNDYVQVGGCAKLGLGGRSSSYSGIEKRYTISLERYAVSMGVVANQGRSE